MASTLKINNLDTASGSSITLASGKVLNASGMVIQTVYVDPVSTEINSTSNSFIDTGLQATITPKLATSKNLICIYFPIYIFGSSETTEPRGGIRLMRSVNGGSFSELVTFIDNSEYTFKHENSASNYWNTDHASPTHFDDHNTTDTIIYKVQFKNTGGTSGGTLRVANNNTSGNSPRMYVQEIAQ